MVRMSTTFVSLGIYITVIFTILCEGSEEKPKVVCYLGSWANYRHGDGKFVIEDIDPSLCTHLIYGFTKLENNRIAVFDPYLDLKENWGLGAYDRFNSLKRKNPRLKTLIAIGGWNEGSIKYSQMAASPSTRQTFITSCVQFLRQYKFDGLDLDWEYPANRGGKKEDKTNFGLLIKELKEAFRPHGFLLTAAVSAGQNTVETAYDIPALGKYLDFINLMSYDFHGGWDKFTGHNAPLYSRPNDTENNKKLNVDYAVNYWLSKGAPAKKLILGMALYGRGFSLQDPMNNGLDAPVNGNGMAGEFTNQPGMLGYNEICKILKHDEDYKVTFEPHLKVPYGSKGKEWIGYDDMKSIALKAKYIQKMKLGGGMVWSIETDDFRGKCHGKPYPLLRVINQVLNGGVLPPDLEPGNSVPPEVIHSSSITPEISSKSTTTTIEATSDANGMDLLPCPHSGYFRHPQDCKLFYFCQTQKSSQKNLYFMFRCSEGTVFSEGIHVCTYPESVPGCH